MSTFLTRTSFLLAGPRLRLNPRVEVALRYAPVCTLMAIIVPDVLLHGPESGIDLSPLNPRLIGALAAAAVVVLVAKHPRLPGQRHGGVHAGAPVSLLELVRPSLALARRAA